MGKHQSPINIDLLHVKRVVLPPLKMNGFDVRPDKTTLKNNGHTGMYTSLISSTHRSLGIPILNLIKF